MIQVQLNQDQGAELEDLFHKTNDRQLRDHLQIVRMAYARRPRGPIAQDLGINRRTAQRWLNAYCRSGLAGLPPRKAPGANAQLQSATQRDRAALEAVALAGHAQSALREPDGFEGIGPPPAAVLPDNPIEYTFADR